MIGQFLSCAFVKLTILFFFIKTMTRYIVCSKNPHKKRAPGAQAGLFCKISLKMVLRCS